MPIGTAVHARTFALAESLNYREWSGYYAVSAYEAHHEHEYNAIRNASALIDISRTGYTGDLGYEIWMPWGRAVDVWDALMAAGRPFDIHAAGMLALDVARVEAGLLLIDVDFNSSKKALIEPQKYSPFEMGLGRLVQLDKGPFVGRRALIGEHRRNAERRIVGLEINWPEIERLYEEVGLP